MIYTFVALTPVFIIAAILTVSIVGVFRTLAGGACLMSRLYLPLFYVLVWGMAVVFFSLLIQ